MANEANYPALGKYICEQIDARGISKKDLADQAKISHSSMYAIITGAYFPSAEVIGDIANALDVPVDDVERFRESHSAMRSGETLENKLMTSSELRPFFVHLSRIYGAADPSDQQDMIVDLAEVMGKYK